MVKNVYHIGSTIWISMVDAGKKKFKFQYYNIIFNKFFFKTFGFTHACEKLIMRMRVYAFENVLRQPIFWFDFKSSSPSNIISRLAKETPLVKSASTVKKLKILNCLSFLILQAGSLRVAQVISAFVTLSAALIIAFTYGWKFAVVLVIGVPIIAGAAYKQLMILQKSQKQDLECMNEAARVRK